LRISATVFVVLCVVPACGLILGSCGPCTSYVAQGGYVNENDVPPMAQVRAARCGVEFVGVYEERCELVPGLRSARSIQDIKRLLDKSEEPGGTNVLARFTVLEVIADNTGRLRPGHKVCLIFRSSEDPDDPAALPERLVGKRLRVVLHDAFKRRYYGRFSYTE
jgi:hypothetical protein